MLLGRFTSTVTNIFERPKKVLAGVKSLCLQLVPSIQKVLMGKNKGLMGPTFANPGLYPISLFRLPVSKSLKKVDLQLMIN